MNKICTKCKKEKCISDFYKDNRSKSGFQSACKLCKSIMYLDKKDYYSNYNARYKINNPQKIKTNKQSREYYHLNKKSIQLTNKKWKDINYEKVKLSGKLYRSSHKTKLAIKSAKYRAKKLQAIPKWYEKELVAEKYNLARKLNFHVDHIVPLQHDLVCGLHCNDNLQLLSEFDNCSKGNKLID